MVPGVDIISGYYGCDDMSLSLVTRYSLLEAMMATATAVDRARGFFAGWGRELDRARFAYHFAGGSREALLEALGKYQNGDGGFGQGLEPDITAPDSQPFATELALLIC